MTVAQPLVATDSLMYSAMTFCEMATSRTNTPSSCPASHSSSLPRSESVRALAPSAQGASDGGKVHFVDQHRLAVQPLCSVLVQLRAIRRVVEDHHHTPTGCREERLEVGQPMSAPPSPLTRTVVRSGRAAETPAAEPKPSPMDWKAVPTRTMACGSGTERYIGAQPMKCPPSITTERSAGRIRSSAATTARGLSRPSGPKSTGSSTGLDERKSVPATSGAVSRQVGDAATGTRSSRPSMNGWMSARTYSAPAFCPSLGSLSRRIVLASAGNRVP